MDRAAEFLAALNAVERGAARPDEIGQVLVLARLSGRSPLARKPRQPPFTPSISRPGGQAS